MGALTEAERELSLLRDRVAALADSIDGDAGWEHNSGCEGEPDCFACIVLDLRQIAASSAPVVSRPEAEVKAEALTEAADDAVPRFSTVPLNRSNTVADWLRARAASLAAEEMRP